MKHIALLISMLAVTVCQSITAQPKGKGKGEPQPKERGVEGMAGAAAVALHLSADDSVKFVAIYKEYLKARHESRKNLTFCPTQDQEPTEEQAETMIKEQFSHSREMLDISEDYYPKFRQVLTARQVLNLYRFERSKFDKARDELHRRGDKGRPGAGGPRRGGCGSEDHSSVQSG